MKEWRDEIASIPLLSPAELGAKVEQMRHLVEAPEFTLQTYSLVNDLEGEIRLVVSAMIVRGTASQQRAAHTALKQSSRLYEQAVRKMKSLAAKQMMAERRASRREVKQ